MENFFRKYSVGVHLALIAIAALLLALVINNIVASQLAPFTVPEMPAVTDVAVEQAPLADSAHQENWVPSIVERCFFGCPEEEVPGTCPDGCAEGEVCEEGVCVAQQDDIEDEDMSDVPVPSELNVRFMGAMVADSPEWSMALLTNSQSRQTHLMRVGDMLAEDAEVIEIHRDRVVVRRGGRLEYIKIEHSVTGNPSASSASARPTPSRRERPTPSRIAGRQIDTSGGSSSGPADSSSSAVEKINDNNYRVDRAAIERELEDPRAVARQARIIPNYKDGERSGLKLVGISPNSIYSQLGIRTGDVLHSVNGTRIENQRQAGELLERLQKEKSVVIEVERQGEMQRVQYNIQ